MSACVALPVLRPPVPALSVLGKRSRNATSISTKHTQIINGYLKSLIGTEVEPVVLSSSSLLPHEADSDTDVEIENILIGKTGQEAIKNDSISLNDAVSDVECAVLSSVASEVSRPAVKRSKTRFLCQWEGCNKSYTKPVRLAEHIRSHTGERPYVCTFDGCSASYLRDTHLTAHLRTHRKDEEKPLACAEGGCDKRFWTNQHLNRHIKLVHDRTKTIYECEACGDSFNKHNKLRDHIVASHQPEGTRAFPCNEAGCNLSFTTASKLRGHSKTHQSDRYICMHPSHHSNTEGAESMVPRFDTWSALQEHNKTEHPPTCLHPGCGRVYRTNKGLRRHILKRHIDLSRISAALATASPSPLDTPQDDESLHDVLIDTQHDEHISALSSALLDAGGWQGMRDSYAFLDDGTATKIFTTNRPHPSLIPSGPIVFSCFNGDDDYAE